MGLKLNDEVRERIREILFHRHLTYAAAAQALEVQATWLGRRLNGTVDMTLSDVELICERLNIPLADIASCDERKAAS